MLVTFALAVLCAAIVVLFSAEITRVVKKILAIKGAALVLPIIIASWAMYAFQDLIVWFIFYYREICNRLISLMCYALPDSVFFKMIVQTLFLTAIAIVPVWVWEHVTRKRSFLWYHPSYMVSNIIWLVTVIILYVV